MTDLIIPSGNPKDVAEAVAEHITSGELTLERLAEIADAAITIQNAFTRARILAERQIAQQYLFSDDEYSRNVETLTYRGWSKARIRTVQKAAQLRIEDIDQYVDAQSATNRDAAYSSALRLGAGGPDRSHIEDAAQAASLPPVDVDGFEQAIEDRCSLTFILALADDALKSCTPQQRHLYRRSVEQGEEVAEIARALGISRQTAHDGVNVAERAVLRYMGQTFIALCRRIDGGEFSMHGDGDSDRDAREVAAEATGVTTLDKNEARHTFVRYTARTEQTVNLGPGSQAMERVEKHTQGASTDTLRIKTHQKYTKEQS